MARAEDPRRRRPVPAPLSTVGGSDMALTELGAMVIFKFAIRLANFFLHMEWQKVCERRPLLCHQTDKLVLEDGFCRCDRRCSRNHVAERPLHVPEPPRVPRRGAAL